MKKHTADFFEKKYRILFNKLFVKEGFVDAVKEARKRLGLPIEGFRNEVELAEFFISKLNKSEKFLLLMRPYFRLYAVQNNISLEKALSKEHKQKVFDSFWKEFGKKESARRALMIFELGESITNHNQMLTKAVFVEVLKKINKYFATLFPETIKLIRKYWALDLLDEHIMGHFVEKYLFMGDYGVNIYIKQKIACPNCRYIGIMHFSPDRYDMEGRDEGPYSKKYIFNKEAVRRLSLHFNSVFLIIKPYATKDELLQYVEDNWNDLREHIEGKNTFYKQFGVHPSKIKESNFEKNRLVYELSKLSKKELIKKFECDKDLSRVTIYKEAVISQILKDEYGITMTSNAVKKSAARFAKTMRVKIIPKDIKDI